MPMTEQATEAIVTRVASAATYAGSGTAFAFGLTASEWQAVGVVGGLVIAVIGLAVNWWFKNEHLRLAIEQARPDREE